MYPGSVIVRLILSPVRPRPFLMPSRWSRKTRPFESTICQCGSGVSGTLKSSESASTATNDNTTIFRIRFIERSSILPAWIPARVRRFALGAPSAVRASDRRCDDRQRVSVGIADKSARAEIAYDAGDVDG